MEEKGHISSLHWPMVSRHNIPCEFIPGFAWLLISKMYVKMGSKSSDNHPQNDITLFTQWQSMMLFLPKSVHLGLPLSLLESQPRLIYEPERGERAQIRGSLSDFTAPFGVQGWDGRDDGVARFPNCPSWPSFVVGKCIRFNCHDDWNRLMGSLVFDLADCFQRQPSTIT